jgi:hypothetical protein
MKLFFGLSFLALIGLSSCRKVEFDKLSNTFWNPKLAAPLAYGSFQVKDILLKTDSSGVIQNNNGVLTVVYNTEFSSLNALSFVTLSDFNQNVSLVPSEIATIGQLPSPMNKIPLGIEKSTIVNQEFSFPVDNGVELRSIDFRSGKLDITLLTDLKHDIEVDLSLPDFLINGSPLTQKLTMPYLPGSNSKTVSFDLKDAIADFTAGNTSVNKIRVDASAKVIGTDNTVAGNEYLDLSVALKTMKFKIIKGYFGELDVAAATDSVSLDLFKNATKGVFGLTNPTVRFVVDNSFGFPAELNIVDMHTRETETNTINPMTPNPSKIVLNYPTLSQIGQSKQTEIILNKTNTTNIDALVTSVPKYFYFSAGAKANMNGNVGQTNFIRDTDTLKVKVEAELPMEGYAYGFEIKDTIDAQENLKNLSTTLDGLLFRLELTNGFPLDVNCQISFLDEFYKPIKNGQGQTINLLKTSNQVIKSGQLDNTGKVIAPTKSTTDIQLSSEDIPFMNKARYVLIDGDIETHDGKLKKSIRLFDDYTISFKLGMQAEGGVNAPKL